MTERDEVLAAILDALSAVGVKQFENGDAEDFVRGLRDLGFIVVRAPVDGND